MLSELWPEESWRGRRAPVFEVVEPVTERPRLVVTGDLDAATVAGLHKAFLEVLRRHCPRGVELDLGGVTFLDTAGITGLLLCLADARQTGCELALRNTPTPVYRVLQLAGLLERLGLARAPAPPVVAGAGGAAMGLLGCDPSARADTTGGTRPG